MTTAIHKLSSESSYHALTLRPMLDLESWASGSIPTRDNILSLDFLFSHSKASDANIGIIANVVYL